MSLGRALTEGQVAALEHFARASGPIPTSLNPGSVRALVVMGLVHQCRETKVYGLTEAGRTAWHRLPKEPA